MRIDTRQLSEAEIQALDAQGALDRARLGQASTLAERAMERGLLAACATESTPDSPRFWFALRTGRCGEIGLCDTLKARGVDAVVPQKLVHGRGRGPRAKVYRQPVLRRLVFVQVVPLNACFAGLLRVDGVRAVIGSGDGRPWPIKHRDMSVFMDLAQAGAFDERNTPAGLKAGDRVKIRVGPLANFEGVLQGYVGSRAARVETVLFGGAMTIDVTSLAHLEKLD